MWIQFHDGTQMVIAADCASVTFTDSSGLSSSHSIGLGIHFLFSFFIPKLQ